MTPLSHSPAAEWRSSQDVSDSRPLGGAARWLSRTPDMCGLNLALRAPSVFFTRDGSGCRPWDIRSGVCHGCSAQEYPRLPSRRCAVSCSGDTGLPQLTIREGVSGAEHSSE
ncbi:hypothetical protein XA68_16555 [Ophiocordyceps unilateralis]|uniref:Uncharacterized protein n=1 Tax=Ophiocordyceps unilateralis TaxID=268505 RepID=A0A2A9P4I9_OPHUN|nr:hypothetical protein XA68_16555 [Ophiocordyceps unilateralis]